MTNRFVNEFIEGQSQTAENQGGARDENRKMMDLSGNPLYLQREIANDSHNSTGGAALNEPLTKSLGAPRQSPHQEKLKVYFEKKG